MQLRKRTWFFALVTASLLIALLLQGCAEKSTVSQSVRQSESQAAAFDYKHIELENGLDVITLED